MQLPIWTLLQHHNPVLHELPQHHSKLRCLCGKWHHHDLHDLQNWLLRLCGCLRGLQCQLQQLHGLGLLELQIYLYCFGNQLCLQRFCIDVPHSFSRHLRHLYEFCDQLSYLHCWNTRHLLSTCNAGSYPSSSTVCTTCPTGCTLCSDALTCTACVSNLVVFGGACNCDNALGNYLNPLTMTCYSCS